MKRLISLFLAIVMLVSLSVSSSVTAQAATDFYSCYTRVEQLPDMQEFNCIVYQNNSTGEKCVSLKYVGYETEIEFPEYYNSMPVLRIWGSRDQVKSITIGSTVQYIDEYAFQYIKDLESINVSPDNKYLTSKDGVLYNKNMTKLLVYPVNKKASSFKIPNTVQTIEVNSFANCRNLKSLTISANVKKINCVTLNTCKKLSKITVAKANKYFKSVDGVLFNYKKTKLISFPPSKSLKSYTIPKTVKKLDYGTFANNNYIKTVKIPKSVKCIEGESYAYYSGCKPAFAGCQNLKNVYYGGTKKQFNKIYCHYTDSEGDYNNTVIEYNGSLQKHYLNGAKVHYNAKIK